MFNVLISLVRHTKTNMFQQALRRFTSNSVVPELGKLPFSPTTPLVGEFRQRILMRGPISISEYMNVCLTHPLHGYYPTRDALGKSGDFVTSPEISQTFGEMIGIWFVDTWHKLGKPAKIQLAELGGGHGTLMHDLLRTAKSFPECYSALQSVVMVDASAKMRERQREKLEPHGTPLVFLDQFEQLKKQDQSIPLVIIAQEFFDALPVHQFKHTNRGWCERMVDIATTVQSTEEDVNELLMEDVSGMRHHFRFVLSPAPTPAARLLLSPKLLMTTGKRSEIEIGGVAGAAVQDIANLVRDRSGAVLIVDYGTYEASSDSLRGIKDHKFCHPLMEPGLVDLSVDVDFDYMRKAVERGERPDAKHKLHVVGPVTQEEFLKNMGIEYRVASLIRSRVFEHEKVKVYQDFQRLTKDMGICYKVMALYTHPTESSGFQKLETGLRK